MTVEDGSELLFKDAAPRDQFPVGMRVLAVDDDLTCLSLLEGLLRRCQYHVTTTNQAIMALKLLRENKNNFDLVISDVHMPDMDGFKLLELVGLEMDLPVIMLSGNSDTKAVMKGITHGAVDYLVKPVRIEELRNIWQHVIRRKKSDKIEPSDREKIPRGVASDGRQGPASDASDNNGRSSRKRKDLSEEDDDSEDNANDNDDPSSQKKPRVVWSVDLHRKFVAAVNELGIDKAVPKRILELMNVERLTRENVASHLQKYRLYLKRIHVATTQQSNLFTNHGGMAMASVDDMGGFNAAAASSRHMPAIAAPLGRFNSLTGIGLRGLSSSGMIQRGHGGSIQDLPAGLHQGVMLNGVPAGVDLNQFQQFRAVSEVSNQSRGGPGGVFLNDVSLQPPQAGAGLQVGSLPQVHGDSWRDGGAAAMSVYSACGLPPPGVASLTSARSFKSGTSCVASPADSAQLDASSHCSVAGPPMIDRYAVSLADVDGGSLLTFPPDELEVSSFGYAQQQSTANPSQSQRDPGLGRFDSQLDCSFVNQGSLGERFYTRGVDFGMVDQQAVNAPFLTQCSDVEKPAGQCPVKVDNCLVGPPVLQPPASVNPNAGSYDDLVNAMIKMESNDIILMDGGDLGCDIYSLETCM